MAGHYTKTSLIQSISSKHPELTKKSVSEVVNSMILEITHKLKEGTPVIIMGFGTFKISNRSARKGRNPHTGAEIIIPARKAAIFKAGLELKRIVNN
jgi:DNA-binding protein HU-beta